MGDTMPPAPRRGRLAQPAVDAPEDGVLRQVDVARVVALVAQGAATT